MKELILKTLADEMEFNRKENYTMDIHMSNTMHMILKQFIQYYTGMTEDSYAVEADGSFDGIVNDYALAFKRMLDELIELCSPSNRDVQMPWFTGDQRRYIRNLLLQQGYEVQEEQAYCNQILNNPLLSEV